MRRMRVFIANERSKGEGKGRESGSEALADTKKIANAPAGN